MDVFKIRTLLSGQPDCPEGIWGNQRNLGKNYFPPTHPIKRGNPVSLSLSLFHRPAWPTPLYRATGSRQGHCPGRLPLPQPALSLSVSLFHSSRLGKILCGLCEGGGIWLSKILSRKCRKGEERWIFCSYILMHEIQESLNLVFQCTNLFCISWSLDYFRILSFQIQQSSIFGNQPRNKTVVVCHSIRISKSII